MGLKASPPPPRYHHSTATPRRWNTCCTRQNAGTGPRGTRHPPCTYSTLSPPALSSRPGLSRLAALTW